MSINAYKYCLRETGTGLKITNRLAHGVSAATGSMTTVLACNLGDARSDWSAPAPIEGLGAQDKVPARGDSSGFADAVPPGTTRDIREARLDLAVLQASAPIDLRNRRSSAPPPSCRGKAVRF